MTSVSMKPLLSSRALMGAATLMALLLSPPAAGGQDLLAVRDSSGALLPGIRLASHRGFVSFPVRELEGLGWSVIEHEDGAQARFGTGGPLVEILSDVPFLLWDGEGVHLADPASRAGGEVHLPLQCLVDILSWKLPGTFAYQPGSWTLQILGSSGRLTPTFPVAADPTRVVIIDAGHGGRDPGTVGSGGTREKDVALAVARILGGILEEEENLEVHLTRDTDVLVPIWRRGELATDWRGDRYGVFISIHANALPSSPGTQGFETYFLSEARTEHERRVAALENAAAEFEDGEGPPEEVEDMSFILTELRNLDHQHWSALLAEFVQRELARFHPGPNRGVKQAPLAVITNTLMPAVLVEVGFLSNRAEERMLNQRGFQEDTARAVAGAVLEFFKRYPPGPDGAEGRFGEGGSG